MLIHNISKTIAKEKNPFMVALWIWRALVTLLILVPFFYITGFIIGLLTLYNPHEVAMGMIGILSE